MGMKGNLNKFQIEEFEWKIEDYSLLQGPHIESPRFNFAGSSWYLELFPRGSKRQNTSGFLDMYLKRISSDHPISLEYSFGLKTADGDRDEDVNLSVVFDKKKDNWGCKILSKSKLYERKSDFLPSDVLTVYCSMKYPKSMEDSSKKCLYCKLTLDTGEDISSHQQKCMNKPIRCPDCSDVILLKNWFDHVCNKVKSEDKKCSYCKLTLATGEDISSHQQKCMNKPIRCPDCSAVILLQNWYDHVCKKVKSKAFEKSVATENFASSENSVAIEKLRCDLKRIMLSGDHSDTTIKVKGEVFKLHRSILGARSPFFDVMFKAEMTEKITGIVSIDDCEPDIFRSYAHFVYTGKVDQISEANVCGLYEIAEKYQEDELKEECLLFMMNSISIESFCDYTILALQHDEEELLKNATKFFASKTKEIIKTVRWQAFLLKYPIQANELHIKSLDNDFV